MNYLVLILVAVAGVAIGMYMARRGGDGGPYFAKAMKGTATTKGKGIP